jgi:hypothetical protein
MAPRDPLDYYLGPTGIPDRIRALNEANPVAGIMRGMSFAGRAADSDLAPELRRDALGEATWETGIALLPVGLGRLASLFRIPAKQAVSRMSDTSADVVETFTGARPDVLDSAVEDASRRRFLQGVGATGVMAALPPALGSDIADVARTVARTVARAAPRAGSGSRIFDNIMQARELGSALNRRGQMERDDQLDELDLLYEREDMLGELSLLDELDNDMISQLTPDELAGLIDSIGVQLDGRLDDYYPQNEELVEHLQSLQQVFRNRLRDVDVPE